MKKDDPDDRRAWFGLLIRDRDLDELQAQFEKINEAERQAWRAIR